MFDVILHVQEVGMSHMLVLLKDWLLDEIHDDEFVNQVHLR